MTERELQDAVVELARYSGWMVYHTYDSRRSEPGFPDLVLAKRRRLLFIELKSERGKVRPEQDAWLKTLTEAGATAFVWRPQQWADGTIERILT